MSNEIPKIYFYEYQNNNNFQDLKKLKPKKNKIKMKKGALEPVDFEAEKRKDPKYKTELCKSFMQSHFCIYGNKCRFAHGYEELVSKQHDINYKKKECFSFYNNGYCLYGSRCNFKHKHTDLSQINFSYYQAHLLCGHMLNLINYKRLNCFEEITKESNIDIAKDKDNYIENENLSEESSKEGTPKLEKVISFKTKLNLDAKAYRPKEIKLFEIYKN